METTVVYYTANSEDEKFEAKIRDKLLDVIGDLPLVSVSQKPLPGFGKNICVGKHDNCYANLFRQAQIGLNEITTSFVTVAEADFLYPPEYFEFIPTEIVPYYRYDNVWVCYRSHKRPFFYFKGNSNGCQVINRDFWLDSINMALEGKKEWFSKDDPMPPIPRVPTDRNYMWKSKHPAITFKTGRGVSKHTNVLKKVLPKHELPYWGTIADLKKEMFG